MIEEEKEVRDKLEALWLLSSVRIISDYTAMFLIVKLRMVPPALPACTDHLHCRYCIICETLTAERDIDALELHETQTHKMRKQHHQYKRQMCDKY